MGKLRSALLSGVQDNLWREEAMAEGEDAKVVIVGCGIAGIAAARRLIDAGYEQVRILEATGRAGGRIKTNKLGE